MIRNQRARRSPVDAEVFAVVGVGASEGGPEACTALLKALPPNTGMGFVLVQHLAPKHQGAFCRLLSTATTMPVSEVTDRTPVQPDHVYVIPPNKAPSLEQGTLRLAPLTESDKLIDNFFSSVARERREKAIGVILSGTASDGTNGLKAIKDLGGATFAQDTKSAKYTGMPARAAASGHVDSVLPPKQIAQKLLSLSRPAAAAASRAGDGAQEGAGAFDRILHLLGTAASVDFRPYNAATIRKKIQQRVRFGAIPDIDQYVHYLENHPEEIHGLAESILNRDTGFFREAKTFRALRARVLPQIAAEARTTNSIRIWVAGCSTGEEVYSLAIALLECVGDQPTRPNILILGTDLSEEAIQKARVGLYPKPALQHVSAERRRRFFVHHDSGYQVAKWMREICIFGRHDLSRDPPFSSIDLISCQNVLDSFEPAIQTRILAGFHYALKSPGFLVLGKAEAPAGYEDYFVLDGRLREVLSPKPRPAHPFVTMLNRRLDPVQSGRMAENPASCLLEEARDLLLDRYSPPAFLVDPKMNVLRFQGDTIPFIQPSSGAPHFHLLTMLRPEFALDVRSLIHQARKSGKTARLEGIQVAEADEPTRLAIEVLPLGAVDPRERSVVVVFRRTLPEPEVRGPEQGQPQEDEGARRKIESLRSELAAAKACLHSIAEEQDAVNAELRSANEEIRSNNEELARANAELAIAEEGLQATNEKLIALNEELQLRNVEVSTFADDLSSLLTGANIPIVILGGDRKIRRFTPAAQRVLDLTFADIGRTFAEVSGNFAGEDWNELLSRVTDKLQTVEKDIAAQNGRWYSLRMRPYRMGDNTASGIMMALIDVNRLKEQLRDAEGSLKATQNLYRLLADSTNDLVAMHGRDTKYIYGSPAFERLLGYSGQDILGKAPTEFCHPEDRKSLSLVFERVARSCSPRELTYRVITKEGKVLWLEAGISPIKDNYGSVTSFQSSSRNVTERKRADNNLRESEFTIRTLMESTSQGILAVNRAGKIVLANLRAASMFGYRKSDFIGMPIFDLIPQELRRQHQKKHVQFFRQPRRGPMDVGLDLSGLHKGGRVFPVEISLSSIQVNHETLAVAFVTDISKRKQAEAALLESHDQRLALSHSLMTAHDEASRRLSRELHDVFSQELAALATESRLLKRDLPRQETAAADKVEGLAQRITKLAKDMHQMSRRLHPAVLDELGLQTALRAECTAFSQSNGISTVFRSRRPIQALDPDVALCLYRVTQESLRNIAKHSGTKTVNIDLAVKKGELFLKIEDFGRGFDPRAHGRKNSGVGLISMTERTRAVGGSLTVDSKTGKGTTILARVPIETRP